MRKIWMNSDTSERSNSEQEAITTSSKHYLNTKGEKETNEQKKWFLPKLLWRSEEKKTHTLLTHTRTHCWSYRVSSSHLFQLHTTISDPYDFLRRYSNDQNVFIKIYWNYKVERVVSLQVLFHKQFFVFKWIQYFPLNANICSLSCFVSRQNLW